MELTQLAGCEVGNSCPGVFSQDLNVVAQGELVTDQETLGQLNLAPGEVALRLPRELLMEAARRMEST